MGGCGISLFLSVFFSLSNIFQRNERDRERLGVTRIVQAAAGIFRVIFFSIIFLFVRSLSQSRESSRGLSGELIFAVKSRSTGLSGISKRRYAHVPRKRSRGGFAFLPSVNLEGDAS